MASKRIAGLIVDLQARTKRLETDLDRANKRIRQKMHRQGRSMASDMTKAFARVAGFVGITVGLGQIKSGVLDIVQAGSLLDTTSQKLSLTTTKLQELRFAGEKFNIQQTTTDMAIQRFGRRLAEAAQGVGELKGTLDQYNISTRDAQGNIRNTTDVLFEYADVIQAAASGNERLRLGFKGFDSEGVGFATAMKDGAQGLAQLSVEAHAFGQVLESQYNRRLAEAAEGMQRLTGGFKTFFAGLVAKGFNLSDQLGITGIEGELGRIEESMRQNRDIIEKMRPGGLDFSENEAELAKLSIKHDVMLGQLVAQTRARAAEIAQELDDAFATRNQFDPSSEAFRLMDRRIQTLTASSNELHGHQAELLAQYPQMAAFMTELAAAEQGRANVLALTAAETSRLSSVLQSTVSPQERYQEQIDLLERAMRAMPGRADEFTEAMTRIKQSYAESLDVDKVKTFGELWKDTTSNMGSNLSDALARGSDGLDSFFDNMKQQLLSAALQAAVVQPLLGFLGIGGAGGGVAGGFSSFFGFADGGRPPVGVPSIVGERGPELFVPDQAGTIVPNHKLAGMGAGGGGAINITQNLTFSTALEDVRSVVRSAVPTIVRATEASIVDGRRRRGEL